MYARTYDKKKNLKKKEVVESHEPPHPEATEYVKEKDDYNN